MYKITGSWDAFIDSRRWHYDSVNADAMTWVPRGWRMFTVSLDLCIAAGFLLLIVTLRFFYPKKIVHPVFKSAAWGLGMFFLIPPIMNLVGIYYVDYAWMVALPFAAIFSEYLDVLVGKLNLSALAAVMTLVLLAHFYQASRFIRNESHFREDTQAAVAYIKKYISGGRAVCCSYRLYFELKKDCPQFFMTPITPILWKRETLEQVDWIINTKRAAERSAKIVGGNWVVVPVLDSQSDWVLLRRASAVE